MKHLACLAIALLFVVLPSITHGHSGKARFHVIIDTDGAPDDLRAISLCFASRDIEVLAIVTSDGMLSASQAFSKVCDMLNGFGHQGIPAGKGQDQNREDNGCRVFCNALPWSIAGNDFRFDETPATEVIRNTLISEDEPVIYLCMGPMTNLAAFLNGFPDLAGGISEVLWYNSGGLDRSGTNFGFDEESALSVIESGLRIVIADASHQEMMKIDREFLGRVGAEKGKYPELIALSHSGEEILSKIDGHYLGLWDDNLPVYLTRPELYNITEASAGNVAFVVPADTDSIRESLIKMLDQYDVRSKVFSGFPFDMGLYADDVAPVVGQIIGNHGPEEFRLAVLTNELHGHLGIYAVIGVKMGLRAREYFGVGIDDIHVLSFAGSTPPVSCMNDGLQVSTGATVGHGLMHVAAAKEAKPAAQFTFGNRSVSLELRPEYLEQVRNDIREGIALYGLNSEEYWLHVRKLAIRYWLEWDRGEIFILTKQGQHG